MKTIKFTTNALLINQFKMKTKKQLQQEGWLFITLSGGALCASKKINDNDRIAFNAKTLLTLRKKIAQWK